MEPNQKKIRCVNPHSLQSCSKEIWILVIGFMFGQVNYIDGFWSFETARKSHPIFQMYLTMKQVGKKCERLANFILQLICPTIKNKIVCLHWKQYSDLIGSVRIYNKPELFQNFGLDHSSLHTLIIDGCDGFYNHDHKTPITWLRCLNLKRLWCNDCLFTNQDVLALANYCNLQHLRVDFGCVYVQHDILLALTTSSPQLQKLSILTKVPIAIPPLAHLIDLYYYLHGGSLISLELRMFEKLEKVHLYFDSGAQSQIILEHLPCLNELYIKAGHDLKVIQFGSVMPSLKVLTLKTHSYIEFLPSTFATVTKLIVNSAIDNEMLKSFESLQYL
jgi:hypothetical protein